MMKTNWGTVFPVKIGAQGASDHLAGGMERPGSGSFSTVSAGGCPPADRAGSSVKRWTAFFLGLAAIMITAFVVIPFINNLSGVRGHIRKIEMYDIDSSSLFYTETEEAFEAYNYLRDNEAYSGRR